MEQEKFLEKSIWTSNKKKTKWNSANHKVHLQCNKMRRNIQMSTNRNRSILWRLGSTFTVIDWQFVRSLCMEINGKCWFFYCKENFAFEIHIADWQRKQKSSIFSRQFAKRKPQRENVTDVTFPVVVLVQAQVQAHKQNEEMGLLIKEKEIETKYDCNCLVINYFDSIFTFVMIEMWVTECRPRVVWSVHMLCSRKSLDNRQFNVFFCFRVFFGGLKINITGRDYYSLHNRPYVLKIASIYHGGSRSYCAYARMLYQALVFVVSVQFAFFLVFSKKIVTKRFCGLQKLLFWSSLEVIKVTWL